MSEVEDGPRQEDMEMAAKLVIRADEAEGNEGAPPLTFYEEKLRMANRRPRRLEPQQKSNLEPIPNQEVNEDGKADDAEPPSVIAIPEEPDEVAAGALDVDDLDTISQSIPMVLADLVRGTGSMSAETLDMRFQQITDMLVELQQQQYESLAHHQPGREVTPLSQSVGSTSLTSRVEGCDPPATLSISASTAAPAAASSSKAHIKPDPPAMQVLIGDMLEKVDPNGQLQTNDLDGWIQERLSAPAFMRRRPDSHHQATASRADDVSLDERKPPAKASGGNLFALEAPSDIPHFDQQWQRAERAVHSVQDSSKDDGQAFEPTAKLPDQSTEPREQQATTKPISYDELKKNASKQLGAIRVAPARVSDAASANVEDDTLMEQEADGPVTAHVVVDEDHGEQLMALKETVASLQQKQIILEATVQQAEPVNNENDRSDRKDDDELSFLEEHRVTILMSILSLGIGIVIGFGMRHPRNKNQ